MFGLGKKKRDLMIKENALGNSSLVRKAFSENMKDAHCCPFLMGSKCIGGACEHFKSYNSYNSETKETVEFWQCVHVQQADLTIELNRNIRELINILSETK